MLTISKPLKFGAAGVVTLIASVWVPAFFIASEPAMSLRAAALFTGVVGSMAAIFLFAVAIVEASK